MATRLTAARLAHSGPAAGAGWPGVALGCPDPDTRELCAAGAITVPQPARASAAAPSAPAIIPARPNPGQYEPADVREPAMGTLSSRSLARASMTIPGTGGIVPPPLGRPHQQKRSRYFPAMDRKLT